MPILVTKTFLVDTEDMDEAYELTRIKADKVDIFAIGRIVPYDPNAPAPQAQPVQTAATGQPVVPPHLQPKPAQPTPPSGTK